MGTVACKPDVERPEVVPQNSVCALPWRNPQHLARLVVAYFELPGYSSLGKGMPSGLIPLVSNVSTALTTCPLWTGSSLTGTIGNRG